METTTLTLIAAAALTLGACADQRTANAPPPQVQRDTGNMAFPTPQPQGNISTSQGYQGGPRDVGNMAYPEPMRQGQVTPRGTSGARLAPTDTGNMAFPPPRASGTLRTSTPYE